MKRIILAVASGALVIAGILACGSSTPSPAKTTPGEVSAISQKSYKDGELAGEANPSAATSDAACRSLAATAMPQGDIESRWVYGCFAGGILGQVKADQQNGG